MPSLKVYKEAELPAAEARTHARTHIYRKGEKEREREREVVEEIRGGEGINIPPSRTGVARK